MRALHEAVMAAAPLPEPGVDRALEEAASSDTREDGDTSGVMAVEDVDLKRRWAELEAADQAEPDSDVALGAAVRRMLSTGSGPKEKTAGSGGKGRSNPY